MYQYLLTCNTVFENAKSLHKRAPWLGLVSFELLGQYQSKLSILKKLTEGRRNNEFISEFLQKVHKNGDLTKSEYVGGSFVTNLIPLLKNFQKSYDMTQILAQVLQFERCKKKRHFENGNLILSCFKYEQNLIILHNLVKSVILVLHF